MGYQVLKDNINFIDTNSNNPKVCFLHGWGRSSKDFKKISESFDYISFDLPGFGKSPAPKSSLNPEEYAHFVLDNLPKSVEIIVGHSFGGRVATHMSLKRKFSKLVLIGVPLIQNKNSSNKRGSLYYLKKFGWWIFLCIALAITTFLVIKKWKSKSEEINMEPQIPLEVQLLERLHSLKTKKLWENGHFKAYYSEISEVIWSFVAYRYQIPTFEKTSNEILESLKWSSIENTYLKELSAFFTISDGVKFAKINPLEKDNIHAIEMAIKFIENERLDIKEAENEHVE